MKYKTDGTIYSDDPDIEKDLDDILNLNCPASYLKENRKAALDEIKKVLYKRFPRKKVPKQQLERMLTHFQELHDGKYVAFAGIVIWYLKRQIART